MRILGLMTVYNESDIVGQVVAHLVSQGIELVIIDNGSTDGSYEICSEFLGKGVLAIEVFPTERFELQVILQRLHQMALAYQPDWGLLSGADEFLESPYRGLTLREAIQVEAEKGYNIIQFNNFEFYPTEKDEHSSEKDVRKRLRHYTWHDDYQYRCWKVYPGMTIHEAAGDIPKFPAGTENRVSPNKFVMRHYKIRSYEHGLRKVFAERLQRYSPELLKKGWHVHYRRFRTEREYFVIESSKLTRYDEDGSWNLTRTFDSSFGAWNPPTANERMLQLQNDLSERDGQIAHLNAAVSERDGQIAYLQRLVAALEREMRTISRSLIFRAMRSITGHIDRAFPDGTDRGALRRAVVAKLHAIADKGRSSSVKKDKQIARSELREIEPPPTAVRERQYVRWLEANDIDQVSSAQSEPRLGYDVILFPIIDWDFRYQRPQQICTQFAEDGHRVFYLKTDFEVRPGDPSRSPWVSQITKNVYEVALVSALSLVNTRKAAT